MPVGNHLHIDHVGSLVRPVELLTAVHKVESGELMGSDITALQDKSIISAVAMQESLELPWITDGEFRRRSWQRGLMDAVGGFSTKPGPFTFRNSDGFETPMLTSFASKKIKRTKGIATHEFSFLKKISTANAKITLPSPTIFHFGFFDNCVDRDLYPDIEEFFSDLLSVYQEELKDLAALGCKFVQFDEVPLAVLTDPKNRDLAKTLGYDPAELIKRYIELNKQIATAAKNEGLRVGIHLCRGNNADLWLGAGGYGDIAEQLFCVVPADAYLMEFDSERAGDFSPLRSLPKGKIAYLGLISTKNTQMENEKDVVGRIEDASRHAELDQLGLCPQCGFSSSITHANPKMPPMTIDLQFDKLSLLTKIGHQVWH